MNKFGYRKIPCYPGYILYSNGEVCSMNYRNTKEPKILKQFIINGKSAVCLKGKNVYIQKLMTEIWGVRDFTGERWHEIPDNENWYASSFGRIGKKNEDGTMKIMKPSKVQDYLRYSINGISHGVHRWVLLAFNPIENADKMDVDHINGNKRDNRLCNLQWLTRSENITKSKKQHSR